MTNKRKLPRNTRNKLIEQARLNRKQPTPAETLLWEHLRNRKMGGLKFRRQYILDRFIADFYCPAANLVIELDGGIHKKQVEEDYLREEVLRSFGYESVRFKNEDILEDIDRVTQRILAICQERIENK